MGKCGGLDSNDDFRLLLPVRLWPVTSSQARAWDMQRLCTGLPMQWLDFAGRNDMHSYYLQVEAKLEGMAAGSATQYLLQDAGTAQSQLDLPQNEHGQSTENGLPVPSQAASEIDTLGTAEQQRHDPTEL